VPTEASAKTGTEVTLTFQNQAPLPHNLSFGPPINKATKPILNSGESETLTFTAPEPGDHKFVCTLHPGMEGVLRVTP
jgi:plastocyanin